MHSYNFLSGAREKLKAYKKPNDLELLAATDDQIKEESPDLPNESSKRCLRSQTYLFLDDCRRLVEENKPYRPYQIGMGAFFGAMIGEGINQALNTNSVIKGIVHVGFAAIGTTLCRLIGVYFREERIRNFAIIYAETLDEIHKGNCLGKMEYTLPDSPDYNPRTIKARMKKAKPEKVLEYNLELKNRQ
ncbi:hypothetical protein J4216_02355 [Candidatus Woesearchaeota archaeon]|nr:hypothetical protein [Candidatus Woesearchaeota archaeon]